jgi:peptidyl-Lys metalloendopeptidase
MPRRFKRWLLLLSSLAYASNSGAQPKEVNGQELSSRIEVESASYGVGQPLNVRFTLTNKTAASMTVLKWSTPLEGIEGNIFLVTREGKPVPFIGRTVKRGAPRPEDYLTIPAGQSVSAVVDLSKAYAIHEVGAHGVELRARLLDYGTQAAAELARKGVLEARSLRAASVTLNLAEARPAPVLPQVAPLSPKPPQSEKAVAAKAPSFKNCSPAQQATLNTALTNAQTYSAGSYLALAGTSVAKRPAAVRYTTWFGVYDAGRYDTVIDHFLKIYGAFSEQTVTFHCDCDENWYAYVYPNQPYNIWVCNAFWAAPATGTDSQFGTLVHETSHFNVVASTDDHVYGQVGCKNLAIANPANAVDNADSHEYFCENNPPLSMGLKLMGYAAMLALLLAVGAYFARTRRST